MRTISRIVRTITNSQPPADTTDVARASEVTVAFGEVLALDGVSLDARPGQCTALMGPNGSGKTTLLRCFAGLLAPTVGSVHVPDALRPVAYVQQRHEGHPWMPLTVDEVIRMGCYAETGLVGRLGSGARAEVRRSAERLEVDGLLRRQFGDLSGGQQQRALLAQALVARPRLLLLDEPLTGLDLASQQRIFALIDDQRAHGVSVVLSTHHLEEARRCDQILLLDHHPIALGPPETVLTATNLEHAFAGRTLHATRDHPIELIDEHGHGTFDDPPSRRSP